jgi:hypothetical protein
MSRCRVYLSFMSSLTSIRLKLFRQNHGLGSMAVQNANAVAIMGGSVDGVTLDGGTF